MHDILDEIIQHREEDYRRLGPAFSSALPRRRERPVTPFLRDNGLIMEIKRASPSKGPISPDLDPVSRAEAYRDAGAQGISILTENRYFKGSLDDLVQVGRVLRDVCLLRKDFLLYPEEIDISYRAGADAVLLIARILPEMRLRSMAARCRLLGMTPFVEIRHEADIRKLESVLQDGPAVAGVNSRDLKDFTIDPLIPAALRHRLKCRAVYESGIDSEGRCSYVRRLGFEGLLIGESVARSPDKARSFVQAFDAARADRQGAFWRQAAQKRAGKTDSPLVKICGITNSADAMISAELGADMLGFVFAESPRKVTSHTVEIIVEAFGMSDRPLCVGVITELESDPAKQALDLVKRGVLDVIQCHGNRASHMLEELDKMDIPRYAAVGIGDEKDINVVSLLLNKGEPRVLCDARSGDISGGTGVSIEESLIYRLGDLSPLWLAGGLGPDVLHRVLRRFEPELVDLSSRLESSPGKKNHEQLKRVFAGGMR
jgi:indole-3-glycerol phosphate synthase/phosphoribosylanthranilate isomerase